LSLFIAIPSVTFIPLPCLRRVGHFFASTISGQLTQAPQHPRGFAIHFRVTAPPREPHVKTSCLFQTVTFYLISRTLSSKPFSRMPISLRPAPPPHPGASCSWSSAPVPSNQSFYCILLLLVTQKLLFSSQPAFLLRILEVVGWYLERRSVNSTEHAFRNFLQKNVAVVP
jgi:hypothetical protein